MVVRAGQRDRLERVCRYALRPPLAQERLHRTSEGEIWLTLRHRWADGTTHLRFDPLELLERLAALTPRPRVNLILYYGVLAPRAPWRAALVPATSHAIAVSDGGLSMEADGEENRPGASRSGRISGPSLMRRTFGLDVLACSRCGGRLRLVGAG
ncbi:MAG: transposase [Acidobacteria bacterium]|nr:transposase [Acidobacteriota bacterium]